MLKQSLSLLIILISIIFIRVHGFSFDLIKNDEYIKQSFTESKFKVSLYTNGSYYLSVNNSTWLASSSGTFLKANGFKYSTIDKSLILNQTTAYSGNDQLGNYQTLKFRYGLYNDPTTIADYIIYTYDDYEMVRFSQKFPNGANRTSSNNFDSVLSAFPSFKVQSIHPQDVGFLSFGGMMAGDMEKIYGKWNYLTLNINDGIGGGPIVMFDSTGNTLIISQMSEFMSTLLQKEGKSGANINFGIMSGVDKIPTNYSVDFVVFYSDKGINQAMKAWGEMLIKYHGKKFSMVSNDVTSKYLSYWMDNGAYYYWITEDGKTYQETIMDIVKDFSTNKIPFKSLQYDSWWYGAQRGFRQGCFEWNGNKPSERFPQSLEYVYKNTGLPITAHNKFWDIKTVYAKEFGGNYKFVLDPFTGKSVPDDQKFWDDLFQNGTRWGLSTYEQDWLNHQTFDFSPLMTDLSLGKRWLTQMGNAALKYNITLQYCMSLSRHVLQSLEIEAVTQVRVTNDYATNWQYGGQQWRLGVSSIFSSSVGLMPFKDVYWTTAMQNGNPYGPKIVNPNTELDSLVSILTGGPVGPGDKIGLMNRTLIMKSCNDEGLLLKPSRPATAIDAQIYAKALGYAYGPNGEVWSTYTKIGNFTFGIIFAADIKLRYSILQEQMGFYVQDGSHYWNFRNFKSVLPLKNITIDIECTINNFCLFHTAPSLIIKNNQVIILGEQEKWIPMSPQRINAINESSNKLTIGLDGVPGEKILFSFLINQEFKQIECNFGNNQRKMTISLDESLNLNCS